VPAGRRRWLARLARPRGRPRLDARSGLRAAGVAAFLLESREQAFDVGDRGLAAGGIAPFDLGYTAMPMTFTVQF
jgi:hypothetical protein